MSDAMSSRLQKPALAFICPTADFKVGELPSQTPGDEGRPLMIRFNLVMLISGLSLLGCAQPQPERLGTPIEGYSHTSAAINRFSVNGNGGPNVGPYGGGGKQNCCAPLPVKWHPGLTVVVEWEKDPNPHASANWPPLGTDGYRAAYKLHAAKYTRHGAVVVVAPYDELGAIDVHFLPCNQVAVSAVAVLPGQPGYPFNFPQKMLEPATCPKP